MKKIVLMLFITALFLSGCKKSYLEINQNPNQPTAVTPNVVLSSALAATASNSARNYLGLTRWMGYWSRSGNYVPDVQTETYNIANDYTDGEWDNLYLNLNNYDYIEKQGQANGLPFYIGVAKVMKAFDFAILVDIYNNVPYSNAFQVQTSIQPTYDDGQTIYLDLVNQLDSAVDYFEQAKIYYDGAASTIANTDAQYDIMFGNGVAPDAQARMIMWQKFANTEKLKLLIHMSEVTGQQSFIQAEIDKITANGWGFLGVSESAKVNPGYQASAGKINPLYSLFYTITGAATSTQNYYRANTYAVDFYANTGDVRQAYLYTGYTLSPGSNYDGDPAAVPNSATAGVGGGILKGFTQGQFILSDFESLFLQAEAAQRGWIDDDAQSLYESAVIQNFVYLYKDFEADDYPVVEEAQAFLSGDLLGNGPTEDVNWDASPNKLRLILTQKWAAMNGVNWVEAYTDYRRTGYPTSEILGISLAPSHEQPKIPVRYLYPQSEYNTNSSNVPDLATDAQFNATIFWDK